MDPRIITIARRCPVLAALAVDCLAMVVVEVENGRTVVGIEDKEVNKFKLTMNPNPNLYFIL